MKTYLLVAVVVAILYCVEVDGQKKKKKTCMKDGKPFTRNYIPDSCREKCRCTRGKAICKPLCRKKAVRCKPNETPVTKKRFKGPNRKCFCAETRCMKKQGPTKGFCRGPDGKQYRKGALFIPSDCSGQCNCLDRPVNGKEYSCTTLCPPKDVGCNYFEEEEEYTEKISGDCQCRHKRCKPRKTGCHGSDDKFYPYGVTFVTADCGGECICSTTNSPTPTCTPSVCPYMEVQCVYGDVLDYYNKTFEGSACICPRVRCKKESCYYQKDNMLHPIKKDFITLDCSLKCSCYEDGSYNCDPLCKSEYLRCGSNEEIYYEEYTVDKTRCKCKRPKCRRKRGCHYPDDNKDIKMGEEYVTRDCRFRCSCLPDGSYKCDPLCPYIPKTCNKNEQIAYENYYYKKSNCICKRPVCEKIDTCQYPPDRAQIKMGEEYVTRGCEFRCRCRNDGGYNCDPLCPYIRPEQCGNDEALQYEEYYYKNSRCRCQKPVCKRRETCRYPPDRADIRMGEEYVTRDCRFRCRCRSDGGYNCDGLCPSTYVQCAFDEQVRYETYYAENSRCQCRRAVCKRRG